MALASDESDDEIDHPVSLKSEKMGQPLGDDDDGVSLPGEGDESE
jgi:hypothetical protein